MDYFMENSKLTTIKHDGVTYWRVADMGKVACKNLDNAIKQTQAEVVYLGDEFGNRPMRCMDEKNFMMVARYLNRRNADESHAKRIEIEIARSKQQDTAPVAQPVVEPIVDTMGEECEPDTVYSEIKLRKFGTIKTMTEFGHTWYCGIDVAKALRYENPRGAVNAYGKVRDDNCLRHVPGKNGRMQLVEYIDEDGVYCLIHHSKRPDAKEFQDWIFSFKKSEPECESFDGNFIEEPAQVNASEKSDVSEIVSQTFGKVRMVLDGENVLFCGSDVARALGYTRPNDAIHDHCRADGTSKRRIIDRMGRPQDAVFITEGNVYRLVAHSKLPSADEFERWVFDEVLPTLRKTGGYISDADKMADTYLDGYDDETKAALSVLLRSLKKSQDANIKLQREVDVLTKQTRTYEPRAVVNALVRSFAFYCLDSDFKKAFHLFYKELYYKKRIALNMRLGTGSLLNRVRDDEWNDVVEVAVALCITHGVDVEQAINSVNSELVSA
jgi:prophage antirepressor-like protein